MGKVVRGLNVWVRSWCSEPHSQSLGVQGFQGLSDAGKAGPLWGPERDPPTPSRAEWATGDPGALGRWGGLSPEVFRGEVCREGVGPPRTHSQTHLLSLQWGVDMPARSGWRVSVGEAAWDGVSGPHGPWRQTESSAKAVQSWEVEPPKTRRDDTQPSGPLRVR